LRAGSLVFDYRGFGTSGGEPRQRISPRDQIEDYRNALTWLDSGLAASRRPGMTAESLTLIDRDVL